MPGRGRGVAELVYRSLAACTGARGRQRQKQHISVGGSLGDLATNLTWLLAASWRRLGPSCSRPAAPPGKGINAPPCVWELLKKNAPRTAVNP
jgi:hypothetical protein